MKTITIDMEAYELLGKARKGGESFSKVIKHIPEPAGKDAHSLLAELDTIRVSEPVLAALERVVAPSETDLPAAETAGP